MIGLGSTGLWTWRGLILEGEGPAVALAAILRRTRDSFWAMVDSTDNTWELSVDAKMTCGAAFLGWNKLAGWIRDNGWRLSSPGDKALLNEIKDKLAAPTKAMHRIATQDRDEIAIRRAFGLTDIPQAERIYIDSLFDRAEETCRRLLPNQATNATKKEVTINNNIVAEAGSAVAAGDGASALSNSGNQQGVNQGPGAANVAGSAQGGSELAPEAPTLAQRNIASLQEQHRRLRMVLTGAMAPSKWYADTIALLMFAGREHAEEFRESLGRLDSADWHLVGKQLLVLITRIKQGRSASAGVRPAPHEASTTTGGVAFDSSTVTSEPLDMLLVTALTEEHQVVTAVLEELATPAGQATGDNYQLYDYDAGEGRVYRVATASAHQMGAVKMGVFAAPLFSGLKPACAALIGIAAAVDTEEVDLGDVPFSSHVVSYDDIKVADGVLTFRDEGYQTDPKMRKAVGALRTSAKTYRPWQDDCEKVLTRIIPKLNVLRRGTITEPEERAAPSHLLVAVTGGGPFLLRDADFRNSLKYGATTIPAATQIRVEDAVHPKLVSTEMESHGFMNAAHECGVPASVLKGISDVGDREKARLEKETGGFYRAKACSNALVAALHILRQRPREPAAVGAGTPRTSGKGGTALMQAGSNGGQPVFLHGGTVEGGGGHSGGDAVVRGGDGGDGGDGGPGGSVFIGPGTTIKGGDGL